MTFDNAWNSRNDENNVPDKSNHYSPADRLVAAPVRISDVGAKEGSDIAPARAISSACRWIRTIFASYRIRELTRTGRMLLDQWTHAVPCSGHQLVREGHQLLFLSLEGEAFE